MNRMLMTGGAVVAASLAVPGIGWAAPRPVELELVGRTPAQGAAGAEIAAHDPRTQRLYVTNAEADALDIYDARRPDRDRVRIDLSPYGGGPNSVDVAQKHGGIVAVAVQAEAISDPGTVELFDTAGRHLASVPAGALPDMVTFTHDEHHLLVANEGERQSDEDDAEGSVTVIDIRRGPRKARARTAHLGGVPTAGEIRTTVGMEPEYIAPAPDDRLAYVSIQEACAAKSLKAERWSRPHHRDQPVRRSLACGRCWERRSIPRRPARARSSPRPRCAQRAWPDGSAWRTAATSPGG